MRISILSPVHNEERHIGEMIASVQRQSHTDWEIIFVDDGSTDRTVEIIAEHTAEDPRVRLSAHGRKLGKAAAYNVAFQHSSGSVVILLAGDDRLPENSLEMRASDMVGVRPDEKRLSAYKLRSFSDDPRYDDMVLPRGEASVSFSGGVLTMSRALAEELFPIDESLPSEDIWLGYAAPVVATEIVRTPEVALEYRIHAGNSNPRQSTFPVMSQRMAERHEAWRLLSESERLQLDGSAKDKLHALWQAELFRRDRKYVALLRADGLGVAERLSFLAMAHPAPFAVRKLFYRALSGRQRR